MTFSDLCGHTENVCLHNLKIHTNFHQNRLVNECSRKEKDEIP